MNKKNTFCTEPKQIGLITWSLLHNNLVTTRVYLLLCSINVLIMFFYSGNLLQRAHFSNLSAQSALAQAEDINLTHGISLAFFRQLDDILINLSSQYGDALMYTTIIIFLATTFMCIVTMAMGAAIKHDHCFQKNVFHQIMCFLFVSMKTYLLLPFLDIIMRTIKAASESTDNTANTSVARYAVCCLAILSFYGMQAYLIRLFNVYQPTTLIPWCEPISQVGDLTILIQTVMVLTNVFDPTGSQILVEMVLLFLLISALFAYRLFFKPMYLREVDLFEKLQNLGLLLVYFIGIICKVLGDTQAYDIIYFMVLLPFVIFFFIVLESKRRLTIINKIKTKSLRFEFECEYSLFIMMQLAKDSLDDSLYGKQSFGEFIHLMNGHIEDCDDSSCACTELENFYDLLKLRQMPTHQAQQLLVLEGYQKYINIIEDHGLIGTISSLTETTSGQTLDLLRNMRNEELINSDDEQMQIDILQFEGIQRIFQIEVSEIKHRFLSELLQLHCMPIIHKYQESLQIQFLQYHYAINFKRKDVLCSFQLSRFPIKKLGTIDQVRHVVTRQYILLNINEMQEANINFIKQKHWIGNLNGDYFIRMNSLQKNFDFSIDFICSTVITFWNGLIKLEVIPQEMINSGFTISQTIQEFFKCFKEIEELQTVKDHQLFFKFALIQLHILNDSQSYEHYIGKMKSVIELNDVYKKTAVKDSIESSNLIIVSASAGQFGNILLVNQNLRLILGWSEDEMKQMKIEQVMPVQIQQKHGAFLTKFFTSGETFIINRKTTVFIKKQSGYVIPVELFIRFYYSVDYEYTYLAVIKPIQVMVPFKNGLTYNIDQLLFLIVENEKDGHVYDFSESSFKILQNYGLSPHHQSTDLVKRISDLVPDLDFEQFRRTRADRYLKKDVYERIHCLDLNQFQNNDSVDFSRRTKTNNENSADKIMPLLTRVFEERFSGGELDINIFCFLFQENDMRQKVNAANVGKQLNKNIRQKVETEATKNNKDVIQFDSNSHVNEKDNEHSQTGSSQSYGGSGISTNLSELRSINSVSDSFTPLTLLLITRLTVALYAIMIIVASVCLWINQIKQNQTVVDINTMTQVYNRMNWGAQNLEFTRILSNIGNGISTNQSNIDPSANRFTQYQGLLVTGIQLLQFYASILQQSSFVKSQTFINYEAALNINMTYLSDTNVINSAEETIATAINSYLSRLLTLSGYQASQFVGHIAGQQIVPVEDPYSPSIPEQLVYSVFQNGAYSIRNGDMDEILLYGNDSHDHATAATSLILITEIVSIIAIICIGLLIAPMLTQSVVRSFKALNYFIKIPKDKLNQMVKSCEYCASLSEESKAIEIMKEYEIFFGLKLNSSQQNKLLKKTEHIKKPLKFLKNDILAPLQNQRDSSNGSNISSNSSSAINPLEEFTSFGMAPIQNQNAEQANSNAHVVQVHLPIIQEITNSDDGDDTRSAQEIQEEAEEVVLLQKRFNQVIIDKVVSRKRIFMAFVIISILMTLTTYFIISYFLSIQTFNTAQIINIPLQAILYKGSCFDQTIQFLRGNIMLNTTQYTKNIADGLLSQGDLTQVDAVKEYLTFCRSLEAEYYSYLVAIPSYLSSESQLMIDMESPLICDTVFVGVQLGSLNTMCHNALNGILKIGLTNTFVYMYRVLEELDMQFDNYGPTSNRTEAALTAMANDPKLKDVQDLRCFIIDPLLQVFKAQLTQSVVNFIQAQLNNFLIAYIIFIIFLTVGMGLLASVGFSYLKQNMLNTNIMLRIIPFEKLDKQDREEVVQFFRN